MVDLWPKAPAEAGVPPTPKTKFHKTPYNLGIYCESFTYGPRKIFLHKSPLKENFLVMPLPKHDS